MATSTLCRLRPVRRLLPALLGVGGLAVLGHGVDMGSVGMALREADARWLLASVALSGLSLSAGIVVWCSLVRDRAPGLDRRTLVVWHLRSVLAGQVVPSGLGGDAVRGLAVARMADRGTALGSLAMGRVLAALSIALWGVAGAALLHDAVGAGVVIAAAVGAGTALLALVAALHSDVVLRLAGRRRGRGPGRVVVAMSPVASTLASWRRRRGLVTMSVLTALAGWGLNLAALTVLARAVGVDAGWQVFAVAIPVTLAATWLPVPGNGVGVREGILVGLLAHAGVAAGPAMALSILVDLQMLPFALAGGLLWMRGCGSSCVAGPDPAPTTVTASPRSLVAALD